MSKKYRLVRTDPGALDLSQILDDKGRPILLKKAGDFAIVNEPTSKHPLVQRFLGAGLQMQEISLTPGAGPATPMVTATAPKQPAPEAPKLTPPEPKEEPIVIINEPAKEPPTEDPEPTEDAPSESSDDTTDDTQRSGKKARRGKLNK